MLIPPRPLPKEFWENPENVKEYNRQQAAEWRRDKLWINSLFILCGAASVYMIGLAVYIEYFNWFLFFFFRPLYIHNQQQKKMAKTKKYDPNKAAKSAHRQALINAGVYGIHKEKSIPSGKAYSRKGKSNKAYLRDLD
jgi:hypothetical protein